MAVHAGLKRKRHDLNDEENYLSDESSFYGDEATKQSYEQRAQSFDPHEWWDAKTPSLLEIARDNMKNDSKPKTSFLYNPYEGHSSGRQLGETVEEFLERLPPESTVQSDSVPWIYIANPFREKPANRGKQEQGEDGSEVGQSEEGAMAEESNWAEFVVKGGRLLDELRRTRHDIEKENLGKAQQTITKKLNPRRDEIVKRLLALAVELKCANGKWMLFCEPDEVNAVWRIIARGTVQNELGRAAKVAPNSGEDHKLRLICVYTEDFTNMKDVTRVAAKLREYGAIGSRGIYYKCNAYTYLKIGSGNEYNIKASMYNSADVLRNTQGGGKVDKLVSKKKREEKVWRSLEYE